MLLALDPKSDRNLTTALRSAGSYIGSLLRIGQAGPSVAYLYDYMHSRASSVLSQYQLQYSSTAATMKSSYTTVLCSPFSGSLWVQCGTVWVQCNGSECKAAGKHS